MRRYTTALLLCLTSCVQVLGLEEAKLREDAGAPDEGSLDGTGGGGERTVLFTPRNSCNEEPTTACETCLMDQCGGAYERCVAQESCRTDLASYAFCLGTECDRDWEDCSFEIDDPEIEGCALACSRDCVRSKLASECTLYCACMADACSEEEPEQCMTACESAPFALMSCRRSHCRSAALASSTDDRTRHCRHASGTLPTSCEEVPQDDPMVCLDRQERGWGCNDDSECCTGECSDGICE